MSVRKKTSDRLTTPAGSPNTHQGVAVLGYAHGDAASHPTITWVVR